MLRALATFSVRHRWLVIVTWLLLVGGLLFAGQSYGGSFSNDMSIEDTDSQAAYDALEEQFPEMSGDGMQVVIHAEDGVSGPQIRKAVNAAVADVAELNGISSASSPYGPGPEMVSEDGATAVSTVRFTDRAADIEEDHIEAAQDAFAPVEDLGVQVEYGGAALDAENHPSGSEAIGLAAAVLVLLVAFGSVFAMLVPLITAVLALGMGMGAIFLLAEYVAVGTAGPVVAAMIGLGVGIDYALLVVTRHREGLATGHPAKESIPIALSTAGRSVLVAGTTVIIAILSLYAIGIPFVATLGLASAITVATTLLAAVTLLPALLGVFGDNLDRFRVRRTRLDHGDGHVSGWHRWTHHVQRRPWPHLVAALALLAVMAAPVLDLRLGTADAGSAPEDSTERAAYELVDDSFGAGWTGPLMVTAEYDDSGPKQTKKAATDLAAEIAAVDGVAQVAPPVVNEAGDTAVLTVVPTTSPDAAATEALVHHLRDDVLADQAEGASVHVGGATATNIDLADKLEERMLWFMGFVVGLSFLLLLVEFRSIFVPIKAAIMNLLSVGAAYGAVVAVFQWGWLADLFGTEPGPIESFAPMMLFAVLFGLSMDYEVFLLSRVREEYLRTGRAGEAVADGIAATARVITAAASVMVVVFASFLLNDDRVVNLFGFGLAVAIAIDATIVRLVLVPAVMAVAGKAAWYMPRWLDRLLPGVELEDHPVDPFEEELDELDPADGAPPPAAIAPANGAGRGTRHVAHTRALRTADVDEPTPGAGRRPPLRAATSSSEE
ncbi:MMPL family transporter [Janibacter cremeus]|uniref:MMPL family transporter n=1 Tax=Janibacter cremeus TaxID=1285192 RepID=UPI0023F7153E|nr:MMPL family transporter [Janibacter cremeus]WEV78195.1 MMPL family transporter [Janibacter cremeus]WEV78275.1 MMPL family transporter [Janibacter cremeus]